jgi:TolB-like protein/AraC-like DNA-binding protein/Tfp pilus assembly protein PilF
MEKQPLTDDQFLALINQIIEDNIDNSNFSVEDLAQKVGLSQSMLHRKLIKLTNKNASDVITETRLAKAKELLENGAETASSVAYRVGFNPSYFNKVFKKRFNISPGNVRKSLADKFIHLPAGRKSKIISLSRLKDYKFLLKTLIIILIIIIAGGEIYYYFRVIKQPEKSVAVLPIRNLTGDPENAYFVDGMHDALTGELGQIESLRVISSTTTLQYRNSDMLLKDIANELGVNIIVEGSVFCSGDSLCFLIQLIDVFPKERHIMANEYRDDMHNALTIQRKAVKDIAHKIRIKLSKDEEQILAKSRTVDPETYKDYLRGMHYLNQGTAESFETGINYMYKAIERDPADPFAYAGLALGYAIKGHGMIAPEGSFRSAEVAAHKALKIDPTLDEAYTALALLYLNQFWDWRRAQIAFENAIEHNPNNGIAHAHYAFYHALNGDKDKALYHSEMAVAIEPFSASYHSWLAWLYYYYGEYEKAEFYARKSLELKEDIPYGNLVLGWTYLKKKQYQKAIELHKKLPEYGEYYKMLIGYTYVQTGKREKAIAMWNEWQEYSEKHWVNPFHRGMLAGMLGFNDKAFELLNEACDNKYYPTIYIDIFPGVEFIRDDPRYDKLLQKMNLPYNKTLLTAKH